MDRAKADKKYYRKHRGKILDQKKEYYRKNRKKILEKRREYYEKNAEKARQYGRDYYYRKKQEKLDNSDKVSETKQEEIVETEQNATYSFDIATYNITF